MISGSFITVGLLYLVCYIEAASYSYPAGGGQVNFGSRQRETFRQGNSNQGCNPIRPCTRELQPVRGLVRDQQTGNTVAAPVFANQCLFENSACDFNRRRGRHVLIRDQNQNNVQYPSTGR